MRTNRIVVFSIALFIGLALGYGQRLAGSLIPNNAKGLASTAPRDTRSASTLSKADLARILSAKVPSEAVLPATDAMTDAGHELSVQYSIDPALEDAVSKALRKGRVPYGAFVAIDPRTGQVLAMVSHGARGRNLSLRSSFPAASIFKIVTAAAAIESGKLSRESLIPVRGGYHTLFKRNVLSGGGLEPTPRPRFARLISFEEALAKSVNSVFGKVGVFGVGPEGLRALASRFLFNQPIPFDLPVDVSKAAVPSEAGFELAESASGFTRNNTLSPLHGALIAAAIANEGVMMEPAVVRRVTSRDGAETYEFQPKALGTVLDKQVAQELALMMHKTVIDGTSRHAFHGASRSLALSDVFIAGKTGTLNGWDPVGRYDWFVGFAGHGADKIAVAALCIHGNRHGLKASRLARTAFETYFKRVVAAR